MKGSEEKAENYEDTFLDYPANIRPILEQCRQEKTLAELSQTPAKNKSVQFQALSHADIPKSAFYNKKTKMDRYCDIWAYEHSRIKLPEIGDHYYINGNQVKSLVDGKVYSIFSQAPVFPFDNFWEAVYYKDVQLIVMLCMFDCPNRGRQAEQYWPQEGKQAAFSSGKIKVTNGGRKVLDDEFVETQFVLEGPQGMKMVKHMHWIGWSDLKKPVQNKMERFQSIISICLDLIKNNKLFWIHCSAGIGRTGTLGGVLEAVRLFEKNQKFSIFKIVQNMRKYRYHAVQTEEQYRFLYSYLPKRLS